MRLHGDMSAMCKHTGPVCTLHRGTCQVIQDWFAKELPYWEGCSVVCTGQAHMCAM
jgi:hypothetical protein